MQDAFDQSNVAQDEEDELPPGMHVVEENKEADVEDDLLDEASDEEKIEEEPPLNLNEEYEAEEGRDVI